MPKIDFVKSGLLHFSFFLLLAFMTFHSCEKDRVLNNALSDSTNNKVIERTLLPSESHVYNVSDQNSSTENYEQTQLGDEINNPYSVSNLTIAQANLYPDEDQSFITATDRYIKFIPTSIEELNMLYKDTDFVFYDYPLHFELLEEGDYYQDLAQGQVPILYAIVPVNESLPAISYEVLDEYNFNNLDPVLLAESFRITGNESEMEEHTGIPPRFFAEGGIVVGERIGECNLPCQLITEIDWSVFPPEVSTYCDCPPIDNPTDPTVPLLENDCGCPVSANVRKPAGCIKVDDTQISTLWEPGTFLPVRRVKVVGRNKFNTLFTTFADDNGCWFVNTQYYGRIYIRIIFVHERASIRGRAKAQNAAQLLQNFVDIMKPVESRHGPIAGPVFNDIEVNYHRYAEQGSWSHVYWGAATANNALHEFHDNATADMINPPPLGLDIYVGWKQTFGYAIMKNFVGIAPFSQAIFDGLIDGNNNYSDPFDDVAEFGVPLIQIVSTYFPDVFIGINRPESDRLKNLCYHEIAHTSHYTLAGNSWWHTLIYSEILAEFVDGSPHGFAFSTNAGYMSVAESWAEFIGLTYLHRAYPQNGWTTIPRTYRAQLERTHNEVPSHIPIGLYHDLLDQGLIFGNENLESFLGCCWGTGGTFVTDNVSNFEIKDMFSLLGPSTVNMPIFKSGLESTFLPGSNNTLFDIDALFFDYGL